MKPDLPNVIQQLLDDGVIDEDAVAQAREHLASRPAPVGDDNTTLLVANDDRPRLLEALVELKVLSPEAAQEAWVKAEPADRIAAEPGVQRVDVPGSMAGEVANPMAAVMRGDADTVPTVTDDEEEQPEVRLSSAWNRLSWALRAFRGAALWTGLAIAGVILMVLVPSTASFVSLLAAVSGLLGLGLGLIGGVLGAVSPNRYQPLLAMAAFAVISSTVIAYVVLNQLLAMGQSLLATGSVGTVYGSDAERLRGLAYLAGLIGMIGEALVLLVFYWLLASVNDQRGINWLRALVGALMASIALSAVVPVAGLVAMLVAVVLFDGVVGAILARMVTGEIPTAVDAMPTSEPI